MQRRRHAPYTSREPPPPPSLPSLLSFLFFFSRVRARAHYGWAHQAAMRVEEDQTDREFFILITPRRAIIR